MPLSIIVFIINLSFYFTSFLLLFFDKVLFKHFYNLQYLYAFFIVQMLRYKIIYDLGKFWTTRILVVKRPLVKTWFFRHFRHPNYMVVFLEVILVCLFFNDINSLIFFTIINSILLGIRIFYEEKANKFRRKL